MYIKILIFCFLSIGYIGISCFNCSNPVSSDFTNDSIFSVVPDKSLLKIDDSTNIRVQINIKDAALCKFTFKWSSAAGQIHGSGKIVKFIAPHIADTIEINVHIFEENKLVVTKSVRIIVYHQIVILKADDLYSISDRMKKFAGYIRSKKIKASLGLIGNSLEKVDLLYFSFVEDLYLSGFFEIWNHGYSHLLNGKNRNGETFHEFWHSSFAYQKEHLLKTQSLAKERLNIVLHTFGAPGNKIDGNTVKVIDNTDDIKVWLFGLDESSKMVLPRFADIEIPVHNPNYKNFLNNYNPDKELLVFQLHPNSWDSSRINEFKRIIGYLIKLKVTFLNPYEYYLLRQGENRL